MPFLVTRHCFLTANTLKLKTTHAQKLQENESKVLEHNQDIKPSQSLQEYKKNSCSDWTNVEWHCKSQ